MHFALVSISFSRASLLRIADLILHETHSVARDLAQSSESSSVDESMLKDGMGWVDEVSSGELLRVANLP